MTKPQPSQNGDTSLLPKRWGQDLIGRVPQSAYDGQPVLEFGSGNASAHYFLESLGYSWTGIDISGRDVSLHADGHVLPFPSDAFGLVVSVAVFEHLYHPFRAAEEVYRVLEPGGTFLGTTAFLESFHANSYFHMTHLGVQEVMTRAGFFVEDVWATWNFTEALAEFWLPAQVPILPWVISKTMRWSGQSILALRSLGLREYLRRQNTNDEDIEQKIKQEYMKWSGAIGFVAHKPK